VTAAIAAGSALIVAAITNVAGWILAERRRQQELTLFRAQRTHNWNLARAERSFQRRADAYAEVLTLLNVSMDWVEGTEPFIGPIGEPPTLPDEDTIRRARALIDLFGSDRTRDAMTKLATSQHNFELAVRERNETRQRGRDPEDAERGSFRSVHDARQDCRALQKAVVEYMRLDLADR